MRWLVHAERSRERALTGRCLRSTIAFVLAVASVASAQSPVKRVEVVYSTDLFHPHDDPDDHLDLAAAFALKELDIRAVLLDQGDKQRQRPGRIPLDQMEALTGRRISSAIGLAHKFETPSDTGREDAPEYQGAVELLLSVLRQSGARVAVIATGSVRDITAAFNREPELLRKRISGVYVNIGNTKIGGGEYNVDLDPQAFRGLLASGLPVYWFPCRPYNNGHSAQWRLAHYADVLDGAPLRLQNFFLYALHRVDPAEMSPSSALSLNLRPWRKLIWDQPKDMWSTASLLTVAGRADGWRFVPARLEVDERGKTSLLSYGPENANIQALEITALEQYPGAMTRALSRLLREFPEAR
jgi:hypothetical protein